MMIVEQLGLAMMPLCFRASRGLISGTTSGVCGSMRNADELSTTTAPALTATGANRLLLSPPAENKARSTPANELSVSSSTVYSRPRSVILRPALRAEASSR